MPHMNSNTTTDLSRHQLWCSSRNSQSSPLNTGNQILSTPMSSPDSSSISDDSLYSTTELNTSTISIIDNNHPLTLTSCNYLKPQTPPATPASPEENTKQKTPENLPRSSPLYDITKAPKNIDYSNTTDSESKDHMFQTTSSDSEVRTQPKAQVNNENETQMMKNESSEESLKLLPNLLAVQSTATQSYQNKASLLRSQSIKCRISTPKGLGQIRNTFKQKQQRFSSLHYQNWRKNTEIHINWNCLFLPGCLHITVCTYIN